jgi:hypothetical protein
LFLDDVYRLKRQNTPQNLCSIPGSSDIHYRISPQSTLGKSGAPLHLAMYHHLNVRRWSCLRFLEFFEVNNGEVAAVYMHTFIEITAETDYHSSAWIAEIPRLK